MSATPPSRDGGQEDLRGVLPAKKKGVARLSAGKMGKPGAAERFLASFPIRARGLGLLVVALQGSDCCAGELR